MIADQTLIIAGMRPGAADLVVRRGKVSADLLWLCAREGNGLPVIVPPSYP